MRARNPVVLTVAGSDSGGGAGIQADLKAISVQGCYGVTVLTALTAQNSMGVTAIHEVPVPFIRAQLEAVMDDFKPRYGKTGMLATAGIVEAVADEISRRSLEGLVVDPVMVSTTGHRLIDDSAVDSLVTKLFPLATIITPNLHETAALLGREIDDLEGMEQAARSLYAMGPRSVLVKGGHLAGSATDCFFDGRSVTFLEQERIATPHTHGSGCVLSAAIAALLARGLMLPEAVAEAKSFITGALRGAYPVGRGPGPVNPFAGAKS